MCLARNSCVLGLMSGGLGSVLFGACFFLLRPVSQPRGKTFDSAFVLFVHNRSGVQVLVIQPLECLYHYNLPLPSFKSWVSATTSQ